MKETSLKDIFLKKMMDYFGDDKKRIIHSKEVTAYAEKILKEEGGDYNVVIPAAVLHDIGIKECERKYNSTSGQLQEKECPPIAESILKDLKIKPAIIHEVCQIIGSHHSPGEVDTLNFHIIWDSDWLVNMKDEYDISDKNKLAKIVNKIFKTRTGKKLAKITYSL
jgi:HD superfamily phosphodiesterase